jgi:hypothetical protein
MNGDTPEVARMRERTRAAEANARERTAKLKEATAELARVRAMYARERSRAGATHAMIADELGVTESAVCHLLRREVESRKDKRLNA